MLDVFLLALQYIALCLLVLAAVAGTVLICGGLFGLCKVFWRLMKGHRRYRNDPLEILKDLGKSALVVLFGWIFLGPVIEDRYELQDAIVDLWVRIINRANF